MLYTNYLKKNNINNLDELYEIYCVDVLNINRNYEKKMIEKIKKIELEFEKILNLWVRLDDNNSIFKIASTNRSNFIKGKEEDIYKSVS